ncbi:hypothetical protein TSAR_006722 [Trichomalopsis sarcophagae]|uniref:Uncharacterized protein n=1 Tax=Trichomalopsis sarcophagae TaxID=543379 RepID=A0A232EN97_9HYME|nr:hypothetical protein TSAR_006722 [Trichomalopsis sarcophagae]
MERSIQRAKTLEFFKNIEETTDDDPYGLINLFQYANYIDRLSTFELWQKELIYKVKDLLEMEFCYDDRERQVFCYYCGIIISPLRNEEEIWTKHAFLTTDCCNLGTKC